jgi:heat shock protein HslJ
MPTVLAPSGPVFTATFEDAQVGLRADCNVCGAGYAAGPGTLAMGQMACTLAYCPSAPFDTDFAGLVQQATSFTLESDRLVLRSSGGTVTLRR